MMRSLKSYVLATTLPLAAVGLGQGLAHPASAEAVAEVVTMRLKPTVSDTDFLEAARATDTYLAETGAVLSRSLSKDADGLWTDHIVWVSMARSRAVESDAMQRPEFGAFFQLMDESTVQLRRAPIHVSFPGSGEPTQERVAEIVTFRLADGAEVADFVAAAAGMAPFLDETGAVLSRTLSRDADGLWTDYILWSSLSAAKSAAADLPAHPAAAPFMSAIAFDTVVMRHADIMMQTE